VPTEVVSELLGPLGHTVYAAVEVAYPACAVAGFEGGPDERVSQGVRIVRTGVVVPYAACRVISEQTVPNVADPENARGVFVNEADGPAIGGATGFGQRVLLESAQAVGSRRVEVETLESAAFTVHPVQDAAERADPKVSARIFEQGFHLVVGQRRRVVRVVEVADEGAGLAVEPVEPAGFGGRLGPKSTAGADPERAVAVLKEGPDLVVAQACRIVRVVAVMCKGAGFTVEPIEPAVCPHPEVPEVVLQNDGHRVLDQARRVIGV